MTNQIDYPESLNSSTHLFDDNQRELTLGINVHWVFITRVKCFAAVPLKVGKLSKLAINQNWSS
jgi:hypothetical protein